MGAWTRWQDWATLILGVRAIISPFAFGMVPSHVAVMWTAVVLGILIVLASLWALARPNENLPQWANVILAILLFISPWVIGFVMLTSMAWSAWILGVLVFLGAGSVIAMARSRAVIA